jgi:hypothetical protein
VPLVTGKPRRISIVVELYARRAQDGGQEWGGLKVSYRVDRGREQTFEVGLQPEETLAQRLGFALSIIENAERYTATGAVRRAHTAAGATA